MRIRRFPQPDFKTLAQHMEGVTAQVRLCASLPALSNQAIMNAMKEGFKSINDRLDGIYDRLDGVDKRFDDIEKRFDALELSNAAGIVFPTPSSSPSSFLSLSLSYSWKAMLTILDWQKFELSRPRSE